MDLRLWILPLLMIQLCSDTPRGQMSELVCREPLTDIPDLIRSYPKNRHRFTDVVDFILSAAMDYVNTNNLAKMSIADVDKTVTVDISALTLTSQFTGQDGWVEDLTTVTRNGDVITDKHKRGSVIVTSFFKIKNLIVTFDKYTFPLGHIKTLRGDVKIKILDNRFMVKTTVEVDRYQDTCHFTLEDLKFEKLGDFRSSITGLWPFNFLVRIIADALLDGHTSVVRAELESKLRGPIRTFLSTIPCGACQ